MTADAFETCNEGDARLAGLPDARDGLTRVQRIVLWELHRAARELGRPDVPTVLLYGRVVEPVDLSEAELHSVLLSLGVRGAP